MRKTDRKLFDAVRCGDLEAAGAALDAGADPNARDEDGWTPLFVAAWKNRTEVAALLITHGADVNAKNEVGWTPLHMAARCDYANFAALLRKHGATE